MERRRFVRVEPTPQRAHWEYRAGPVVLTVARYLLGQHRVMVMWDRGDGYLEDILPLQF